MTYSKEKQIQDSTHKHNHLCGHGNVSGVTLLQEIIKASHYYIICLCSSTTEDEMPRGIGAPNKCKEEQERE